MDEQEQQFGNSWISQTWREICDLSVEFRIGMMIKDEDGRTQGCDPDLARQYIAKMTRLWLEVLPEVEGKTKMKIKWKTADGESKRTLEDDFLLFRPYSADPSKFFEQDKEGEYDSNKLFLLEEILRKVINNLPKELL